MPPRPESSMVGRTRALWLNFSGLALLNGYVTNDFKNIEPLRDVRDFTKTSRADILPWSSGSEK